MRDLPEGMDEMVEDGAPARIEHVHEEYGPPGAVEEVYDYLIYAFDTPAGEMTARAYSDEMHTVSIMTEGPGGLPPEVPPAVEAWLRRRFACVRVLGATGYEVLRRR